MKSISATFWRQVRNRIEALCRGVQPLARHSSGSSRASRGRRRGRAVRMQTQVLEVRVMLSATPTVSLDLSAVAVSNIAAASFLGATPNASSGTQTYSPTQIRQAYGFDQVMFGSVHGDGSGQTIAIVDAYGDPNILADLQKFDAQFQLADPLHFKVVNQTGGSSLPSTDAGWALETSLDVEWAHAMAPGADILLVQANSANLSDLLAAVNYAKNATGVSVVSMSWGSSEFSGENTYDSYFTTPSGHQGVTFVASSGDTGAVPEWPAVSTNILSVGGTALNLTQDSSTGTWSRTSETAWSDGGGGYSTKISEPSWQLPFQSSGKRGTPDVSYDADPNTGFYVYDSVPYQGGSGWWDVGGTSAGAPQWAALIAVVNQGRALNQLNTLDQPNASIYGLASGSFYDVTSGSAGSNAAQAGYDLATGLGSPNVNSVVQQLSGGGSSVTPPTSIGAPTASVVATTSTSALISWTAGDGDQGFKVYRVNSNGTNTLLATLGASATSFSATGLTKGSTVSFFVQGTSGSLTADSSTVSVKLPTTNLTSPRVSGKALSTTSVQLSWSKISGLDGYRVFEKIGGVQTPIGTLPASATSVQITNLQPGTTYQFLIEAYKGSLIGDSSWVSVKTKSTGGFGFFGFTSTPTALNAFSWGSNTSPATSGSTNPGSASTGEKERNLLDFLG